MDTKMKKKIFTVLLGISALALVASTGVAVYSANAEGKVAQPVLTMQTGAAIRTFAPTGIRFVSEISKTDYETLTTKNAEFYTLIIPEKLVPEGGITADNYKTVDAERVQAKNSIEEGENTVTFSGTLVGKANGDGTYEDGFPDTAYNMALTAVSYYTYTENEVETVVFANNPQTYSIAYIASALQAKGYTDPYYTTITDNVLGDSLAFEKANYTVGNGSQLATAVTSSGLKVTSYESSNNDVVTVDENGMLTAVSDGTAEITAKIGGKTATTTVSVFSTTVDAVASEKIYADDINSAQVRLSGYIDGKAVDGTETLSYAVTDGNVATVSETGLVTALNSGKTQLTVTYGDTSTVCTVDTTKENVRRVDLLNVGLNRWAYNQNFRNGQQSDTLLDQIYGLPIGGRNPVGNYFWNWKYTCSEATAENGVQLYFKLQNICGKSDATVEDLKSLYSAGYTTVVMPIYLQYNETTDKSNEPRQLRYYEARNHLTWGDVTHTTQNPYAYLYNGRWNDVEFDLAWLIYAWETLESSSIHIAVDAGSNFLGGTTDFTIYVDGIYATRGTTVKSFGFDDRHMVDGNQNYATLTDVAYEYVKLDNEVNEQGRIAYTFNSNSGNLQYWLHRSSAEYTNDGKKFAAMLTTLKNAGYTSVRYNFYVAADVATGSTFNIADKCAPNGDKTGCEQGYIDQKYSGQARTRNCNEWVSVEIPIEWMIQRLENAYTVGGQLPLFSMIFELDSSVTSFKVYMGAIEAVKL